MRRPFVASKDWYLEYITRVMGYYDNIERLYYHPCYRHNKAVLELWRDLVECDGTDVEETQALLSLLDIPEAHDGSAWFEVRGFMSRWKEMVSETKAGSKP